MHCHENPTYVVLFWEMRGLSPNFHIHVSVSDLFILRIGPHISLQQNMQKYIKIWKYINLYNRYMSAGTRRQIIIIVFWKEQFHFWEYINGNQTF
jgi:hypothetical protein